jgi:hypothetical protein
MKTKNWIKKNKNLLIILGVIGIILIFVLGYNWYSNYVFEQKLNHILNSNISIDSRIIDEIQVSNQVSVIVRLYENKDYNNDYVRTNVLSTVSNSEFILELTYDSSPDFAGKISLDGLEKLANNPNVKRIEFDEIVNLYNSIKGDTS